AWEASGHVGGFSDPMVDCKKTKLRYRADHLFVVHPFKTADILAGGKTVPILCFSEGTDKAVILKKIKKLKLQEDWYDWDSRELLVDQPKSDYSATIGPDAEERGTLTEPRSFNLMFKTYVGATATEDDVAYL